jgi:hypothetical protein
MSAPHASIEIAAPAQRVWEVLAALPLYPAWAPFTVAIDGALALGGQVTVHVEMTPGAALRLQPMTVTDVSPPARLAWTMTLLAPLLLHAEREQRVEGLSASACRYSTTDRMSGLLAPLVLALYGGSVASGLQRFAAALKARAEAQG